MINGTFKKNNNKFQYQNIKALRLLIANVLVRFWFGPKHYQSFFATSGFLVKMKIKLSGNKFSGTMTTEMSIKLEEIAIRGNADGGA